MPHLIVEDGRVGVSARLGPLALAVQIGIVPIIERLARRQGHRPG